MIARRLPRGRRGCPGPRASPTGAAFGRGPGRAPTITAGPIAARRRTTRGWPAGCGFSHQCPGDPISAPRDRRRVHWPRPGRTSAKAARRDHAPRPSPRWRSASPRPCSTRSRPTTVTARTSSAVPSPTSASPSSGTPPAPSAHPGLLEQSLRPRSASPRPPAHTGTAWPSRSAWPNASREPELVRARALAAAQQAAQRIQARLGVMLTRPRIQRAAGGEVIAAGRARRPCPRPGRRTPPPPVPRSRARARTRAGPACR